MSGRQLNDWISGYLKYTENTEPPLLYHTWTAISLIAGALQRRLYMTWGHDTIYPNMYVVLVGPSGRARKGTAMNIGRDIMKGCGIKTTSESITREALIRTMKESPSTFTDTTTGKVRTHCAVTAYSEELSVFLGQGDVKFLADLTDWYDARDSWTYQTKGAGTDSIEGICFNLLGATAPDWLQSILPQEALGGGFTSRIIFVVEEDKGKTVPEPIYGDKEYKLRKALKADLERIAISSGEIRFTDGARQAYINWYEKHEQAISEGRPAIEDPRFSGYLDRRATHLRKLSMALSMSRSDDLRITEDDFTRADLLLQKTERNMPKVFGGLGQSKYSQVTEKILQYIIKKKKVKRSELLRQFYRDVDTQTLKIIEEAMEQMKLVKITRDVINTETIYEYRK